MGFKTRGRNIPNKLTNSVSCGLVDEGLLNILILYIADITIYNFIVIQALLS